MITLHIKWLVLATILNTANFTSLRQNTSSTTFPGAQRFLTYKNDHLRLQEITWLIMNKADTATAREKDLFSRSPFLEMPMMMISSDEEVRFYWKSQHHPSLSFFQAEAAMTKLDLMTSPRLIKTHLPFELLPPNLLETCKVVFVARFATDFDLVWPWNWTFLNLGIQYYLIWEESVPNGYPNPTRYPVFFVNTRAA